MEHITSSIGSINQSQKPQNQTNRYEVLNYSELATSKKSEAASYKWKAYAVMALGLGVFIIAVAGAATLATVLSSNPVLAAPIVASVAFIFGLQMYNAIVKNKYFKQYRTLQAQAENEALIYEKYATHINLLKHQENHPDWTHRQWDLAGKRAFWIEEASMATTKLQATSLNRLEKHFLMEGHFLSARVHAAYFDYMFNNSSDDRLEEDFIIFNPLSLEGKDRLDLERLDCFKQRRPLKRTYYITLKNNPNLGFSRESIRDLSIEHLATQIFARQKAA